MKKKKTGRQTDRRTSRAHYTFTIYLYAKKHNKDTLTFLNCKTQKVICKFNASEAACTNKTYNFSSIKSKRADKK